MSMKIRVKTRRYCNDTCASAIQPRFASYQFKMGPIKTITQAIMTKTKENNHIPMKK